MGNSPSTTGLDRGGAHGRRDIVRDGSRAEQRPARFQADESDSELADSQSEMESNRKSKVDNAPEPSFGYNMYSLSFSIERKINDLERFRMPIFYVRQWFRAGMFL